MSFGDWPDSSYANQALSVWSASPYFNLAGQIAQANNINPSVFQAVIGAESGYDQNATNGNAIGLGQLIVGSAPALSGIDAGNPQSNLNAAANFYSQLLQECGGDNVCASAKYGTYGAANAKTPYNVDTTGFTPNQTLLYQAEQNANQNTGGDSTCFDPFNTGVCVKNNKLTDTSASKCGPFDFVCQVKTAITDSGANLLSIVAGLVLLVVGLVMLRDHPMVQPIISSAKKTGQSIASIAALAA